MDQYTTAAISLSSVTMEHFSLVPLIWSHFGDAGLAVLGFNSHVLGAAVSERLAYSPPTKANRVKSPAGSLSHVRIVPDDAAGWLVFSEMSRFPRPGVPALLHTLFSHLSSALKISPLRAAQIAPLSHVLITTESRLLASRTPDLMSSPPPLLQDRRRVSRALSGLSLTLIVEAGDTIPAAVHAPGTNLPKILCRSGRAASWQVSYLALASDAILLTCAAGVRAAVEEPTLWCSSQSGTSPFAESHPANQRIGAPTSKEKPPFNFAPVHRLFTLVPGGSRVDDVAGSRARDLGHVHTQRHRRRIEWARASRHGPADFRPTRGCAVSMTRRSSCHWPVRRSDSSGEYERLQFRRPLRTLGRRTRRNAWAGETGDPRENPPTTGIVRHDSHLRKSGLTRPGLNPAYNLTSTLTGMLPIMLASTGRKQPHPLTNMERKRVMEGNGKGRLGEKERDICRWVKAAGICYHEETGVRITRENPLLNYVRHVFPSVQKSSSDFAGNRTWFALAGDEWSVHHTTAAAIINLIRLLVVGIQACIHTHVHTWAWFFLGKLGRGDVVVWLLASHKGKQGSIPGGVALWDFRVWESCRTSRWSVGFLGDLPFSPSLHSGAVPYSPRFNLAALDLDVKSRPNLFIHSWQVPAPAVVFLLNGDMINRSTQQRFSLEIASVLVARGFPFLRN
ncbi:hypothetical protein PR048_001395 [Dryococelus australis]|uniref:Uncharacterized protein n=1 Tax=Dryococelus australis TaxID=614101 RepID=A0ABQ9IHD1_9NEOP|nr:hypothetical protein PR048_001395 [Dryococelus australis]